MRIISVFVLSAIALFACEGNPLDLCENNPFQKHAWLKDLRDNLAADSAESSITQYSYNHKCVYLVAPCENCSDAMATVYNDSGKEICVFGGIAGFNTCPDFEQEASNAVIIFKK